MQVKEKPSYAVVAAVQLLRTSHAPQWQQAALVPMFALFYVVLAPFVGAFADSMPKGRVMLVSNFIKISGSASARKSNTS